MPKVLPSAEACLDHMQGMRGEALAYRDEIFDDLTEALKVKTACQDMRALLAKQTASAFDDATVVGDSWSGKSAIRKREAELTAHVEKEAQASEKDAATHIQALQEAGVQSVHMDLAVDADANILVGYNLPPEREGHMAALFNDTLYTTAGVVSRDSQLLQSRATGEKGEALPATPDQIEASLAAMQKNLKTAGIPLEVTRHPYEEVKKAISSEKQKSTATEKKATRKRPGSQQEEQKPEDKTRPT